jgi:hypothetical protein
MPTFQGLVTEEQLMQLVAYVQSLQGPKDAEAPPSAGSSGAAASPGPDTHKAQDAPRP